MLQQTTVAAVVPYFERWMARFPHVNALATAEESEVLAVWQGLGYYRRARNLWLGARQIAVRGMPSNSVEWRAIPGVGAYTAGAIASIAHDEDCAAVDGNVERVFARLTANSAPKFELNRQAWRWADSQVPVGRARDWTQALMELGATICRPRMPVCAACPVAKHCRGLASGDPESFPTKPDRVDWRTVHHYGIIYRNKSEVALRKAQTEEWWEGLWVLPRNLDGPPPGAVKVTRIRHVVTKHKVTLDVYLSKEKPGDGVAWFAMADLDEIAIPSPDRRALAAASKFQVGTLFPDEDLA